jgi:hypothetical protein
MNKPVAVKKLDISKITYTALSKGKNGGKVMFLKYENKPLTIQLPKMSMPFGAADYNGNEKFSINFSFDMDNGSHKEALEVLQKLDEKLIEDAATNSQEWFDAKRSADGIRDSYQSQIKMPKDTKYSPRLKAGMLLDGRNGFRCSLQTMDGERVSPTKDDITQMIPSRSVGVAILECVGVWIVQKSLTLTWKVAKMKYTKGERSDLEFDSDSDSDDETKPVADAEESAESSDSSVDVSDEEEVEVTVKPDLVEKVVKRTGGKAKKTVVGLEK